MTIGNLTRRVVLTDVYGNLVDVDLLGSKRAVAVEILDAAGNIVVPSPITGYATSANQTNGTQKTQIVDAGGDTLDLWHSGDTYTAAADHGIMVLARSGETPNRYRPLRLETAGADDENNTNDRLCTEAYGAMYDPADGNWDRVRGDTTAGLWTQIKASLPAGTNYVGKVRLTDGTNDAVVEAPATYLAPISGTAKGQRVTSLLHQRWSADHPDTPGGDNNFYPQNMNDRGDVLVSLGSIRNNVIDVGAGTVASGTQRCTQASNSPDVTALQIIDDWDESDRCKTNLIVGQAGITAGAGAVAANTPRVTHASDDPVTTALQIMDDWDESDRAKVNLIASQAGVDADTGLVTAKTIRTIRAFNDDWVAVRANYAASAQTDTALVTATAGQRIVVKKLSVTADKANSVDTAARIGFGATNTPTTTGVLLSHPGIAAGSGVVEFLGEDGVVGADGEDLRITSEAATGGSIDVLVVYKIV